MSKKLEYIYFSALFLWMCASMHVSFTFSIPLPATIMLAALVSFIYYINNKCEFHLDKKGGLLLFFYALWLIYESCVSQESIYAVAYTLIRNMFMFVSVYYIVAASLQLKQRMFNFFCGATCFILILSLIGWGLFVLGVPLPNTVESSFDDGFHTNINYYLFSIDSRDLTGDFLPRFGGMFLEAGQLASVSVLLLLPAIILHSKRFYIWTLSIAVLLSFSLAGWLVLLLGVLFMNLKRSKNGKFYLLLVFLAIGYSIYERNYGSSDSLVNVYINDRLQFDSEKGLSGNNRTGGDFDMYFESFKKSDDVYFGIAKELLKDNDNWTTYSSGYLKFIVFYGYIGFFISLIVFFLIYNKERSYWGVIYLLCFILLCFTRYLGLSPYWLVTLITVTPMLQQGYKNSH